MIKQQKGVSRNQGTTYHHNLDPFSSACLRSAQEAFQGCGNEFSASVVVRRALRLYHEHVERLKKAGKMEGEMVGMFRAGKGVV